MNFQQTFKEITSSQIFKDFIKKNKNAKLYEGFFIIDFFGNDNKKSLNYRVNNEIFTFSLNDFGKVVMEKDKLIKEDSYFEEIDPIINYDIEDIENIVKIKTSDEGIKSKFNKIIAVLQNFKNQQLWNLTCMLDGLIILHIIIDSKSGELKKFERKSFMDLVRKK